jgi:hypothetical protein
MTTPANPENPTPAERSQPGAMPDRQTELAQAVSDAVLDHPAVVRLDSGPFGVIASYLPGERLVGVSLGAEAASAEVAVVLSLDYPIPPVVEDLRSRAQRVLGEVPVDVTVADVVADDADGTGSSSRVEPVAAPSTERRVQ